MTLRIGLHAVYQADPNFVQNTVAAALDAGIVIPIMTIVHRPALAKWIKARSPETIVVNRVDPTNRLPAPGDNGAAWVDGVVQDFLPDCENQIANEHNQTRPDVIASFYEQAATRARKLGFRITIGDLSSGAPAGDPCPTVFLPMLQMTRDYGFYFNYHNYSPATPAGFVNVAEQAPYYALRYKFWTDACPDLRVICAESGTGSEDFQGIDKEMALVKQMNALVDVPCAWWSLGHWDEDNGRSDIDPMVPDYLAWSKTMGGTPPTNPPPAPDPDDGLRLCIAAAANMQDDDQILVRFLALNAMDEEQIILGNRFKDMCAYEATRIPAAPNPPPPPPPNDLYVSLVDGLRVRSAMDTSTVKNILTTIDKGTQISILRGSEVTQGAIVWARVAATSDNRYVAKSVNGTPYLQLAAPATP